jgi:DNA-binding MltR family transcriptional regulator
LFNPFRELIAKRPRSGYNTKKLVWEILSVEQQKNEHNRLNEEMMANSHKRLEGDVHEYFNLLLKSFEGESERSIAIVSICIIDEQLEKLIRSYFIKDAQVRSLFNSEHILQTFYAKYNIAYFSGLIPRWLYTDLTTLGKIRNRFAHEVGCNLQFSDPSILKLINKCAVRLKILDGILGDPSSRTLKEMARLQYVMITSRVVTYLSFYEEYLTKLHLPKFTDLFNFDESDIDKHALTKSQFLQAISHKLPTP